ILQQPINATANAGQSAQFTVVAVGQAPISYQWLVNGTPISGANNQTLIIDNITPDSAANYSVIASNSVAAVPSSAAALSVNVPFTTTAATNMWSLNPTDDNGYIGDAGLARGIAYDPVYQEILMPIHPANSPLGTNIPVYQAFVAPTAGNGNLPYSILNPSPANTSGVYPLDMCADDSNGVFYVGNLTTAATNGSPNSYYYLYQYDSANPDPNVIHTINTAFAGDPGYSSYTNKSGLRWGDTIALRGAGAGTQILLASGTAAANNWVA